MDTINPDDIPCHNEACAECGVPADSHHEQTHKFVRSRIAAYGFAWWNGELEEKLHIQQCRRLAGEASMLMSQYLEASR